MGQNIVRRWGFIIGGILFLIAALVPLASGRTLNVTFFVIGIAFLIIGAGIARKSRDASPPK